MGERKEPAHEIRVGRLKLAVWRNDDSDGTHWFNLILTRSYKDTQGKWHSAHTLGKDDALVAAEMLRLAWLWIASSTGAIGIGDVPVLEGDSQSTSQDGP